MSFFQYGFDESPMLLVPIIFQAASGGLGWVSGTKEWLADRVAIIMSGFASLFYAVSLFAVLEGFRTIFANGSNGWWLVAPTAFYLIVVPLAFISVVRLSLYDKFRR